MRPVATWEAAWKVWESDGMLYDRPWGLESEGTAASYLAMNGDNRKEFRELIRKKFGPVWTARFAVAVNAYRSKALMMKTLDRQVRREAKGRAVAARRRAVT
jgi:hypothetical protein